VNTGLSTKRSTSGSLFVTILLVFVVIVAVFFTIPLLVIINRQVSSMQVRQVPTTMDVLQVQSSQFVFFAIYKQPTNGNKTIPLVNRRVLAHIRQATCEHVPTRLATQPTHQAHIYRLRQ
jgi:archaellum biogenesis protein FlaJ (TadC family)